MKLRRTHLAGIVDVNRNFGVALDASDGLNDDAFAHYPNPRPSVDGVRPSSRSVKNAWMVGRRPWAAL